MTKDEALKLALEALEGVHQDPKGLWNCHVEITAIKAALAQTEQIKYRRGDWLRCLETDDVCVVHMSGSANQWVKFPDGDVLSYTNEQVTELFDKINKDCDWEGIAADQAMKIVLMKSEQEPVARIGMIDEQHFTEVCSKAGGDSNTPLYTAPPKREEQKHFKLGYDAGVLETQLDQALERNFCPRCGTRLISALGPVSLHTCCPPQGRTFDDYGNKIV